MQVIVQNLFPLNSHRADTSLIEGSDSGKPLMYQKRSLASLSHVM